MNNQTYITKAGWLHKWAQLISAAKNLNDFPVWLQYFGKLLFQVINRSGRHWEFLKLILLNLIKYL